MDRENAPQACCCCVVVTIIVMMWLSFSQLSPLEFGIDFNAVSYSLGTTEGPGGRHFLGPGHSFIKFPAAAQNMIFSGGGSTPALRSRTYDGLEVKIELTLQYRFELAQVIEAYQKFGLDYEKFYRRLTIDVVTREATGYNSSFIFTQRKTVEDEIRTKLKDAFRTEGLVGLNDLQLQKVDLPSKFESAITLTQTTKQDVIKADQERGVKETEGETLVQKANQDRVGIVIRGEADAASTMLNNQAFVEQFNITQTLAAQSYQGMLQELGSNETQLLEYLRMRALRDHKSANSIISFDSTANMPAAAAAANPEL